MFDTTAAPQAGSLWRLPASARVGWLLYAVSLLTPASPHAHFIGAFMLIFAPLWGIKLLFSGALRAAVIGICLLAGFAANVSLFMKMSAWLRVGAMVAPWLTFGASLFAMGPPDGRRVLATAFFFPWAAGIALINLGYMQERKT